MKVKAKVLDFGMQIFVVTAIGLGYAKLYGQSEEDKEAMLREKYPDLIAQSQANRKPMQQFFDTLKNDSNNPEVSKKMDDLLKGGKSNYNKKQGANVGKEASFEKVPVVTIKKKEKVKGKKKEKEQEKDAKGGWWWW